MAPAASRHEHAHFRFPSSHRAVALRPSRVPSRDTADLPGSPRRRAARPACPWGTVAETHLFHPPRRRSVRSRSVTREPHGPAGASRSPARPRRRAPSQPGPPRPRPRRASAQPSLPGPHGQNQDRCLECERRRRAGSRSSRFGPRSAELPVKQISPPQWASWPPGLAAGGGGRTSIVRDNDFDH